MVFLFLFAVRWQFFYDVKRYQIWFDKCREIGIKVPILPGYLPIQNYNSFQKFTVWCKTAVPAHIATALEKIKDDDEQVRLGDTHPAPLWHTGRQRIVSFLILSPTLDYI